MTPERWRQVTGVFHGAAVASRAREEATAFLPGTVLARRYRIVTPLGRGGMGEVYRADDLKLGQAVALRFLPTTLRQDPNRRQRLRDEVKRIPAHTGWSPGLSASA